MNSLKVKEHIDDALAKGATLVRGGQATGHGLWFEPTLLDHCSEEMSVVTEETFGPVLAIVRVDGVTEAVEAVNRSAYALGVSLWTENIRRAKRLVETIHSGIVTVNNHALTGAIAHLPWSGLKKSGYDVAGSELALNLFTRPKTVLIDHNKKPEPFWLPYDRSLWELGQILADAQQGVMERLWKVPLLLQRRKKTIQKFFH